MIALALAGALVSAPAAPRDPGRGLSLPADCGTLTVTPIAASAVRVRCAPGAAPPAASLILIHSAAEVPFTIRRRATAVSLVTAGISATYDRTSGVLRFLDARGRLLLEEVPGARKVAASQIQQQPTLAVEDRFRSPADEHLFGSGQFQDGFLDVRDLPRRLTQVNSQIALPFLVSSKGYGLLWHNYGLTELNPADERVTLTREAVGDSATAAVTTAQGNRNVTRRAGVFVGELTVPAAGRYALLLDVGVAMAQRYHAEIDGATVVDFANRWLPPTTSWFQQLGAGRHVVRVVGEQNDKPSIFWRAASAETVLRSPVSDGLDYVVIAGGAEQVIATYRKLSGPAPLLPAWAYGFIQCRERYTSSEDILENAREFRARSLPMDVIVQDWQYWGKYGWNAMRWDERYYPDPAGLVRQLHGLNARLMVSVWPRIDRNSTVGKEFAARSLFLPGTDWVDFFNPEARALYWKELSSRMLSLGIDAWWQDATEPENDALAGQTTFAGPGDRFRLVYPLLVTQTVYEGQRRDAPDRRVFILTRSAFPGEQRYAAATWSGDIGNDWATLRRQIPAGLDFSVSGLPWWTVDAGGFFRPGERQYTDTAYHERFLRWLQFAAFSPLMRVHGYMSRTEPWRYGPEVEAQARTLLDLRYRLLPYIYSQAAAVTLRGSTLMRPLVMDFAADTDALAQKYEYMFGPSFLVAPVLEPGASHWPVYAPVTPGGWWDWWAEVRLPGGATAQVEAPLSRIPLLVKAGSIVPLGPVQQYSGQDRSGALELRVYPGADADFALYEDEGVNYRYEKGAFSTIALHWNDRSRTLTIGARKGTYPGMPRTRSFTIHIAGNSPAGDRRLRYEGNRVAVAID